MNPASHDFDQFISGGYYLAEPVKRHESFPALLPETIITLSPCLTEVGPRVDEWEQEPAAANSFEVMPFGFSSFAVASTSHARAVSPKLLLGIGLHVSLAPLLHELCDRDINNGYALIDRIEQHQPLSPGKALGFEPLGFYAMSFHSWLCNYFPDSVSKDLNVQPAANGFIADYSDAVRVTEYIGKAKGEPAIWLPWLVVQYGADADH